MSIALRVAVVASCFLLLLFVVRLVARERLLLKYSLLWLALGGVLLISALFPEGVFELSLLFGFENASNFIFFLGLFCLLLISLSLSVIVSKQTVMIKNLTQRIAINEHNGSTRPDSRKYK